MAGRRVLLVDDHPGILNAVSLLLEGHGFQIIGPASTLEDALKLAAGADAVLLDVHLPDAHGPNVARKIQAAYPDLPILIHSAELDDRLRDQIGPLGLEVAIKGDLEPLLEFCRRL